MDLRRYVNGQIKKNSYYAEKHLGQYFIESALWNALNDAPDEDCSFLWSRRDLLMARFACPEYNLPGWEDLEQVPRMHADRIPHQIVSRLSPNQMWHSVVRIQLLIDGLLLNKTSIEMTRWTSTTDDGVKKWPENMLAIWPYVRTMALQFGKRVKADAHQARRAKDEIRTAEKERQDAERKRQEAERERLDADNKDRADRPNVSAAAKRRLLSLYGENVEYVRDAIQFADFHSLLGQNLGIQHNSAVIENNAAMMADRLLKTAARERVRSVYLANKDILADTYPLKIFEEHLQTMLNEFAALRDFQEASESLIATITGMVDRLRPAYEACIAKEQHELDLRRTEEERREAEENARRAQEQVEQAAREREAKVRSEIEQCIRAEAGGQNIGDDDIKRELELRMARWSIKNRRE